MICGFVMKYADILLTPYIHTYTWRIATILFMVYSVLDYSSSCDFLFLPCASSYNSYYCSCINFWGMLQQRRIFDCNNECFTSQYQTHNHYCRNSFYTPLIFNYSDAIFGMVCLDSHTLLHKDFCALVLRGGTKKNQDKKKLKRKHWKRKYAYTHTHESVQ